ncbi:polysaccharide pyruvyl transferase family protein [Methanothermobacter sp.]|uniref:polysaccharide pyruvyl transferase family protein n=1 Tax=Methanothermobacter sp. TaxID=1884223 RepID=UPI003C7074A8
MNKGNEALLKSTMSTIKYFVGDSTFFLLGVTDDKIKVEGVYYPIITNPYFPMSLKKPLKVFESLFTILKIILFKNFNITRFNNEFLEYINSMDIIINSGGDHLSGEYGRASIITLINILYALFLDKPVVLYSESLGYHKSPLVKYMLNYVLERSSLILVREFKSYEYLNENLKSKNYYLTADSAFLLDSRPPKNFQKEKFNQPLIGFNVSPLISNFAKDLDIEKISIKSVEFFLKHFDGTILLIPHVYGDDSDLKVLSKIYGHFDSDRILLISDEYGPEELKFIIGCCDLFIGARMHATIASTSMFVPTVGIAYSHKMHGIIGEMIGLEDYVIDLDDLSSEILIEKTLKAWENREEIKKHLNKVIPEVKRRALKNGELVKKLCESLGIS